MSNQKEENSSEFLFTIIWPNECQELKIGATWYHHQELVIINLSLGYTKFQLFQSIAHGVI